MDHARSANAIAAQVRWERLGIDRAIKATQEAVKAAEEGGRAHELPAGRKLLQEVVPKLTLAIQKAQAEAVENVGAGGRSAGWAWPIGLVDADKLAVITVATCLRFQGVSLDKGAAAVVSLANYLSKAVKSQVEFDSWSEAQEGAARAAKKEAKAFDAAGLLGPLQPHQNLLKALEGRYPDTTLRTWAKWQAKIKAIRLEDWDEQETRIPFGNKLIHLLTVCAPDRFVLDDEILKGGMTQRVLRMTPKCLADMDDVKARMEIARPQLMPMIIPPNPWRYEP